MSHISYAIATWGSTSTDKMTKVLALQKRGIRYLLGLKYRDSCREHFRELKILTAPAMYILQCIKVAASHPEDMQRGRDFHEHDTRHGGEVRLPRTRKHRTARLMPSYQGLKFMKLLPKDVLDGVAIGQFNGVKKHLIGVAPYTVAEFCEVYQILAFTRPREHPF